MELDDCAFPTLAGVEIGDDANTVFDGANLALLVGARPRTKGMERGDLLEANGAIFTAQGKALNEVAADDIRIGVTGNPANTNALIAHEQRPRHPAGAVHRADPPRPQPGALAARREDRRHRGRHQEADDLGQPLRDAVLRHLPRGGQRQERRRGGRRPGLDRERLHPDRAKRGAAIIEARGSSSAASAASATIDAARDWLHGSPEGDWVSMAVRSDGSYGVPEGLVYSYPVITKGGDWEIVQGLEIDDFSRGKMDATAAELVEERDAVTGLGLI